MTRNLIARSTATVLLALIANGAWAADGGAIPQRVEALLRQMTLEEKVGQLHQISDKEFITGPESEQQAHGRGADRPEVQRVERVGLRRGPRLLGRADQRLARLLGARPEALARARQPEGGERRPEDDGAGRRQILLTFSDDLGHTIQVGLDRGDDRRALAGRAAHGNAPAQHARDDIVRHVQPEARAARADDNE
mgnify:CR=1 FL=1